MIADILRALSSGVLNTGEMARQLGLDQQELRGRLEMLTSMGWVESITALKERTAGSECRGCAGCKKGCSSPDQTLAGYRLTEKGKRALALEVKKI